VKEEETILKIRGMVKDYPGVRALNRVNLEIQRGEIHGLVGENGAGKSTLIKILAGVVAADEGEVFLSGKRVEIRSGRDAYDLGFSFIHQELNLIPYFNCLENVFLGHPFPKTIFGTISWKSLRQKTESVFRRLGMDIPLNVPVSRLTPGNQAMVAIARAFAVSASVYFLDEPTASLTSNEKEKLFSVMSMLKERGATIVYVSHQLGEITSVTDRVTVMRDGEVVGTWRTKEIDENGLIRKMIGRDIVSASRPRERKTGKVIFEVRGLSGGNVRDISFGLWEGEILGIAGLVGSGRTELLRMIYGVDRIEMGEIYLRGKRFKPSSPKDSVKRGIVLVPEERRTQGLVMMRSIYENITLVYLNNLSTWFFLNRRREREEADRAGSSVKLKTVSLREPVCHLSGGNQQKVVFAKCLLRQPSVLLLDEPTRGVDVGARFEIYTIIRELAARGTAIILVSSDFNELVDLADRLLILHKGEQKAVKSSKGMDQQALLTYCYGRVNDGREE